MIMNEVETISEALLRETLQQASSASVTVAGESMAPLLRRGDLIGLRPLPLEQVRPGQIVTFSDPLHPGGLQTHRVIGVHTAGDSPVFYTRGDRALTFDPPLKGERLLGRVVWRQRDGRALTLMSGRGLWLSAHLGRIAEQERRWVTGVRLPAQFDPAAVRSSDGRVRGRLTASWVRALRLGSRTWSRFVAALITLTAAPLSATDLEM